MAPEFEVIDLGHEAYATTLERMLTHAAEVRKGKGPGKVLLVEHDPVYTAGRGTPAAEQREDAVAIDRGGGITYHGPGQLVVYPVVRLPRRDVRAWLTTLENFGIGVCSSLGLEATASDDGTGVFVDGRKVISIGVTIRGWVNTHGISINVDLDLAPFHAIRPCGLDPQIMADLCRVSSREVTIAETAAAVRDNVAILGASSEGAPR